MKSILGSTSAVPRHAGSTIGATRRRYLSATGFACLPGVGCLACAGARPGWSRGTSSQPERRLFTPSPEQLAIVELARERNVVVSARPGSGKTATAEAIVAANPDKRVAVITYSKRLQLETARRLAQYPGCDVLTFHGMAGRLFSAVAYNDQVLRAFRHAATRPAWNDLPFDMVVLDEFQDCTEDLFWLICTFLSAQSALGGVAPRIVTLGDERQAIYDFRGADSRHLALSPDTLSALSPYQWTRATLSKSFRLSRQTAHFVNQVFLGGEEYVTGFKQGPKPVYIHSSLWRPHKLAKRLVPFIRHYGPENTAILAPHVRQNLTLSRLTNLLSEEHDIKIAVSVSDDMPLDDLVIGGKVCVSTYHQFKGNERDLTIVYGVDAGYFEWLGRDLPDDRLPNASFVGLTRALKQLIVVHNSAQPPMPFMSMPKLYETAQYVNLTKEDMAPPNPVGRPLQLDLLLPRRVAVSDMARHVPDPIMESLFKQYVDITHLKSPLPDSMHIRAPDKVLTDDAKQHWEAVSDLNGMAVVAAWEHARSRTLSSVGLRGGKSDKPPAPKVTADDAAFAAWLCRRACEYDAKMSGYVSRKVQMEAHDFAWLGAHLGPARERLEAEFDRAAKVKFEVPLKTKGFGVLEREDGDYQYTDISGRADVVEFRSSSRNPPPLPSRARSVEDGEADGGEEDAGGDEAPITIYEIKFVASLSLEHATQALVYAYLWAKEQEAASLLDLVSSWTDPSHGAAHRLPRIVLFNIRDGAKWSVRVRGGLRGAEEFIERLLKAKHTPKEKQSAEEFLRSCEDTRLEVERVWFGKEESGGEEG